MKKIFLISIILLIIFVIGGVWFYYNLTHYEICGQMETWGINEKTGECKLFGNTCLAKGYITVKNYSKCDCDSIENRELVEECKKRQEIQAK